MQNPNPMLAPGNSQAPVKEKKTKSKFTPQEDQMLSDLVARFGENDWKAISFCMRTRSVRQCRERWQHYLSPACCQRSMDRSRGLPPRSEVHGAWPSMEGNCPVLSSPNRYPSEESGSLEAAQNGKNCQKFSFTVPTAVIPRPPAAEPRVPAQAPRDKLGTATTGRIRAGGQ